LIVGQPFDALAEMVRWSTASEYLTNTTPPSSQKGQGAGEAARSRPLTGRAKRAYLSFACCGRRVSTVWLRPGSMLTDRVQQALRLDAVPCRGHQQHHILHVSQYFTLTYTYHPSGLAPFRGGVTTACSSAPGV
jgi:hypothetical protein